VLNSLDFIINDLIFTCSKLASHLFFTIGKLFFPLSIWEDALSNSACASVNWASILLRICSFKASICEKEMGSQLGAGENEIINNKIQLFNTEADLTTQLSDLQKSQSSMDGAIKSLQSAYDGATQYRARLTVYRKQKTVSARRRVGQSSYIRRTMV